MALDGQQSPHRLALVGFLVAVSVSLFVGIVVLGDPWWDTIGPAVGIGIGSGIGFYLYQSEYGDAGTVE